MIEQLRHPFSTARTSLSMIGRRQYDAQVDGLIGLILTI